MQYIAFSAAWEIEPLLHLYRKRRAPVERHIGKPATSDADRRAWRRLSQPAPVTFLCRQCTSGRH